MYNYEEYIFLLNYTGYDNTAIRMDGDYMGEKKRINVGMFINSLYNDYSTLVCKGAVAAAEELDVNLLLVPGREINARWSEEVLNRFEYQNNTLYSYVTENNIDVLLMSLGTFAIFLSKQEIQDFLKKYSGIRIVIMETIIPGYPCILFGDDGLRDEINHVINEHGARKVAFLTGQKGQSVAEARLKIFREVMAENGIPVNESYIEYGDFSEWCVDKARELLDRNADDMPEAICCANDSMVRALEKAMTEKGLKIGRDILVTGYDDAQFAGVMEPPLTTVKSYMMTMGYEAVELAVKYYKDGINEIHYVKTGLIRRESCGCPAQNDDDYDTEKINADLPADVFTENIINHICEKSSLEILPEKVRKPINDFVGYIHSCINSSDKLNRKVLFTKLGALLNEDVSDFFNINSFRTLFTVLKQTALEKTNTESEKKIIYDIFGKVYHRFSSYLSNLDINREERTWLDQFLFARITAEMMEKGKDEEMCFNSLIETLSKLNDKFESMYIYMFGKSILNQNSLSNKNEHEWIRPEKLYLRAFYREDGYYVPDEDKRELPSEDFLCNPFVETDKRKTYILESLYFNDELYGVLMLESKSRYFTNITSLSKQLCTAIKMTRFTNLLENALNKVKKTNEILSRESVSDQLTSLYNRRGFMIEADKIICSRSHDGFKGAVLFADLDYLKVINDTFGHKNGDFAIRKAASLLKENLDENAVIGRIGGDEFIAFVPDAGQSDMENICSAIRRMAKEFNDTSDKPYYVNISMGVYCFDSADGESLEQLMTNADRVLYENKKLKSKTALKP